MRTRDFHRAIKRALKLTDVCEIENALHELDAHATTVEREHDMQFAWEEYMKRDDRIDVSDCH
jgi:hypothetical protein